MRFTPILSFLISFSLISRGANRNVPIELCWSALTKLNKVHAAIELNPLEQPLTDSHGWSERDIFQRAFWDTLLAQAELAEAAGGKRGRAQHRKIHGGGMVGEAQVLSGIPSELAHGLFKTDPSDKITTLVRFSSGMGEIKPDILPDVSGLAVKIIREKKDGTIEAFDLTFTKSASGFASTIPEFVEFLQLQAERNLLQKAKKGTEWLVHQPRAAWRVANSVGRPFGSLENQSYGSGHPYMVGDTPVRFTIEPKTVIPRGFLKTLKAAFTDANYLGTDLKNTNQERDMEFVMYAQTPPKDGKSPVMMVEDGLAVWDTPKIPVMTIRLPKGGMSPEMTEITERVGWNPGTYFDGHRGAGNFGRGRPYAYTASQLGRWWELIQEKAKFNPGLDQRQFLLDLISGKAFEDDYRRVIEFQRSVSSAP